MGCVYMRTDCTNIHRLKEDVLSFKEKGRVALLGDFNTRVGLNL